MKSNRLLVLAIAFAAIIAFAGTDSPPSGKIEKPKTATAVPLSKEDEAALELGRKVFAIQRVLQNPNAPDAMNIVTDLGHDTRYYVMVRGWLSYQLSGDQSILDASHGGAPKLINDRAAFLKKAIRYLDLE